MREGHLTSMGAGSSTTTESPLGVGGMLDHDPTMFQSKLKPRTSMEERKMVPPELERRGEAWLRMASRDLLLPVVDPKWELNNTKELAAWSALKPNIIVETLCAKRPISSSQYMIETMEQIERDLPRTYPDVDFFANTDIKDALGRILRALAIAYPETGYVQGMNFLAANILLHMRGSEDKTFLLLRYMMEAPKYRLVNVFQEGLPNLRRFTDLLSDFMQVRHPLLFQHFEDIGLEPLFYSQNWTVTLFSYMVPFLPLAKIWDRFFEVGWEAIFKHGLAFFHINIGILMAADFEKAAVILRSTAERPPPNLSNVADTIKLTPEEVERIAHTVQLQEQYSSSSASPHVAHLNRRRSSVNSQLREEGCASPATIISAESPKAASSFFGSFRRRQASEEGPRYVSASSLAYGADTNTL
mmetsp:Transcript_22082/g.43452  ORF Transcript_22082/g.43452 Transcript_22082/m.43452 type:complete len:415 (+) Transcript_22082:460-1704(+)